MIRLIEPHQTSGVLSATELRVFSDSQQRKLLAKGQIWTPGHACLN